MPDIFEQALAGDSDGITALLEADPALVHARNRHDRTPLHYAAREGHANEVRLLLEAGAEPDIVIYPNKEITLPRTLAEARGHADVVAVIDAFKASRAANGTARGEELCEAARSGDSDQLRQLLAEGADAVDETDVHGRTALHWAAEAGHLPVALELLHQGANPNARDRADRAPIHDAVLQHPYNDQKPSFAVAGMLLERGAQTDVWVAAALGDVPTLEVILRANPAQANAQGVRPPLAVAAQHGHLEAVKCLLDCGADPDAPMVDDPNHPNPYTNIGTPLHFAVLGDHRDVAEALLEGGANPNTNLMAARSAVSEAYSSGQDEIAELLFRHGAVPDVWSCWDRGNWPAVLQMFEYEPERASKELLRLQDPDLTRICLQHNPEFSEREQFHYMFGTMRANTDDMEQALRSSSLLQMYLEYGFDPNRRDQENVTLLHRTMGCMWRGRWMNSQDVMIEFTRVLLDHGADPNLRDDDIKSTPIAWHARYGHDKVVEYLLSRGVTTELSDDEDWNAPMAWAKKQGHERIVGLLS